MELEESGPVTSGYTTKLQSLRQHGTGTNTEKLVGGLKCSPGKFRFYPNSKRVFDVGQVKCIGSLGLANANYYV